MSLLDYPSPRATCQWKVAGTETFRLGSQAIAFNFRKGSQGDKRGTNLQNQTKATSQIIIADPGKTLVNVDQSGAEALVVAYEVEDGAFRALFKAGIKSHIFVALHVFASVWQEKFPTANLDELLSLGPVALSEHPAFPPIKKAIADSDFNPPSQRYYHIAKMACHALNYGMMHGTFQQNVLDKSEGQIVLTENEAKRIYNVYHGLFPEIKKWHGDIRREVSTKRELRNLFGYPRKFTHAWSDELLRQALSFKPQSTVGTITNIVFTKLQTYIEDHGLKWDVLNNKHDSVLAQCPDKELKQCVDTIQSFMNMPLLSTTGNSFRMKSGAEFGKRWTPHKKDKQEDGMKGWGE